MNQCVRPRTYITTLTHPLPEMRAAMRREATA